MQLKDILDHSNHAWRKAARIRPKKESKLSSQKTKQRTKPVLVNTSVGGHRYLKLTYGLKSRGDKFIRDKGECFQTGVTRERNFGQ